MRIDKKRHQGSMLVDVAIGMALVISAGAYVFAKSQPFQTKGDESLFVDHVILIADATNTTADRRSNGYNGIDIQILTDIGMLPSTWSDGIGINPVGGVLGIFPSEKT